MKNKFKSKKVTTKKFNRVLLLGFATQPYPYKKGKKITWVLVEAGPKATGFCSNDKATISDLQTEKITPFTDATMPFTVKHFVSTVKYPVGSGWKARLNSIGMFQKCFGPGLSTRPKNSWFGN